MKREFTTNHTNITNKTGISDEKFVVFVCLAVKFLELRNMRYKEFFIMNEFGGRNVISSKIIALILIVTVMVTTCALAPSSDAEPGTKIPPISPGDPPSGAIPTYFYMNGNEPSIPDMGRTGFMVAGVKAAEHLLVVSDDTKVTAADHPVVYFYGIEDITSVEIHFAVNTDFPSKFVIHQQGMPDTVGNFSAYNTDTETFSVVITCGDNFEIYTDLVLRQR
jgi:hypothetical protein